MGVEVHRHVMGCCLTRAEVKEEKPDFEVIMPATPAEPSELSTVQKRIVKTADSIGFKVEASRSVIWVNDVLMVNDGKTGKAGSVKKPAHEETNIFLKARYPGYRLGFLAVWLNGKFSAKVSDPVGDFRELYGSYAGDRFNPVPEELEAERNALYNDGESVRINEWWIDASTEFEKNWLATWERMLTKREDTSE